MPRAQCLAWLPEELHSSSQAMQLLSYASDTHWSAVRRMPGITRLQMWLSWPHTLYKLYCQQNIRHHASVGSVAQSLDIGTASTDSLSTP